MIHVLLILLKIIGIVIAVLLLLVLLVLGLVLFAPIRYRARVVRTPDREEVLGRVSFLFPLVVFKFRYFEKVFSYQGRAFWYVFAESGKNKEKPVKKKKVTKKAPAEQSPVAEESGGFPTETVPEGIEETKKAFDKSQKATENKQEKVKTEKPGKKKKEEPEKEKTGFMDKVRRLLRQKDEVVRIIKNPEHKKTFLFVWGKLKKTLRHILPQKVKGYLVYGNADPAVTGQVLGILSVIYAATGPVLKIVPDFENVRLECDLEFKGRLRVFTLLVILLKIYRNKELKKLMRELKAIREIE